MRKAIGVGSLVLLAGYCVWGICLYTHAVNVIVVYLFWLVPAIAGFVAGLVAPRRWLAVGICLAIPAAMLAVVLNDTYELSGHLGDFPGVRGALYLAAGTAAWTSVASTSGALIAHSIRRRGARDV